MSPSGDQSTAGRPAFGLTRVGREEVSNGHVGHIRDREPPGALKNRSRALVVEAGAAVIAFHVKGDRYDRVLAPPDVLAVLAMWHQELDVALGHPLRANDAVIPPVGGHTRAIGPGSGDALEPMTTASISYQVRLQFAHVGIVGRGSAAHALRATAATVAQENGTTIEEIQAMLGHMNRPQTEAYIRRRVIRSAAAGWVPGQGLDLPTSP